MVRRKQSTMFLVAREGDTVAEVRRMIAGVCGQQAQDVRLFLQENTEKGDRISGVFIYFFYIRFFKFCIFLSQSWRVRRPCPPWV